jgi:two-component system OmpR family response regulator
MPTILIVDDDDAIRAILYDLLCDKYECDTACLAEEALRYLEVESYDAILTDLAMPGLGGVALLKKIQEANSSTPVILISGKGAEQDPQDFMDLGAFAYVNKPFNLDEIEEAVERAIGKHR